MKRLKNKSTLSSEPIQNCYDDDWRDLARPFWHNISYRILTTYRHASACKKESSGSFIQLGPMADDCGMLRMELREGCWLHPGVTHSICQAQGKCLSSMTTFTWGWHQDMLDKMLDFSQHCNSVLTCLNILHRQTRTSMRCWCQGYSKKDARSTLSCSSNCTVFVRHRGCIERIE